MGNAESTPDGGIPASNVNSLPPAVSQKGMKKSSSSSDLILATEGMKDTMDFRVFALDSGKKATISMWHDIPLYPSKEDKERHIVNMICEVRLGFKCPLDFIYRLLLIIVSDSAVHTEKIRNFNQGAW